MKANNILNRILAELSSIREVKFEQMTLENGAVLEAEAFEAGNEVFIVSGEDRVAAPVREHQSFLQLSGEVRESGRKE